MSYRKRGREKERQRESVRSKLKRIGFLEKKERHKQIYDRARGLKVKMKKYKGRGEGG